MLVKGEKGKKNLQRTPPNNRDDKKIQLFMKNLIELDKTERNSEEYNFIK